MAKKRERIEIIEDILQAIRDKDGRIKPTHLMYKANLSHKSMKDYLTKLLKNNLVKFIFALSIYLIILNHYYKDR